MTPGCISCWVWWRCYLGAGAARRRGGRSAKGRLRLR
jgi:hypothetical protein